MSTEEENGYWGELNWSYPTLNRLCNDLRDMGVEAKVVTEEGFKELDNLLDLWKKEVTHKNSKSRVKYFITKEFGFLEIKQSPIKWINLHYIDDSWWGDTYLGEPTYEMRYFVPDSRHLPCLISATTKYVKRYSIFGRIVDIRWSMEGDTLSKSQRFDLEQHLNKDKDLKTTILSSPIVLNRFQEISLCSPFLLRWWEICIPTTPHFLAPSIEEWHCHERIATLLLKAPIPA